MKVAKYEEAVRRLLSHLEDVLNDDAWELINTKLWNAVSLAKIEPNIVTVNTTSDVTSVKDVIHILQNSCEHEWEGCGSEGLGGYSDWVCKKCGKEG